MKMKHVWCHVSKSISKNVSKLFLFLCLTISAAYLFGFTYIWAISASRFADCWPDRQTTLGVTGPIGILTSPLTQIS